MAEEPSLWGWGRPQRTLLALVVTAGAAALLADARPRGAGRVPPPGSVAVDVNTAPPAVLLALPGLGPGRVDGIVAAREEGPFASLGDLERRVKGIGPTTVEGLRPFVRFGQGPTVVDRDRADEATAPRPRQAGG